MSSETLSTPQRIMKATWRLMEAERAPAVRMSDIAKAAGVSRQAIYLHFENRAALLTATTRYMDDVLALQGRLAPFREAEGGEAKIRAFIAVWAGQVTRVQGVARALLAMRVTDAEADAAWRDRMAAMREGCASAVAAVVAEGRLAKPWSEETATDIFAATLSFETWDHLTTDRGWSEAEYISRIGEQMTRTLITP